MRRSLATVLPALAIGALTLFVYRELPARLFAADDYQWLLNVRGLSFGELLRHAFDAGAQNHFYRPLVWLLFWAQVQIFGLDVRGFHAVSLALHLINAGLLGALAYRLVGAGGWELRAGGQRTEDGGLRAQALCWPSVARASALVAAAVVALHPAPFEAVVWIAAQSELLAALLLLLMLHLWLPWRGGAGTGGSEASRQAEGQTGKQGYKPQNLELKSQNSELRTQNWLLASLVLVLALLAKESAVIGVPLLMLVGFWRGRASGRSLARHLAPDVLPVLLTLAYLVAQIAVERRNYLLRQGEYGLGPQIVLNPLRGLALLVAPLAGTEHADAAWLAPVGALVALGLMALLIRGPWGARRLVLALGLTLLPTAPFVGPPNSRYLYLPVMAAALLLAAGLARLLTVRRAANPSSAQDDSPAHVSGRRSAAELWLLAAVLVACAGAWLWAASGELHDREWRFAAGAGPGGSLWRVAEAACVERRPSRLIIVDPPVAGPHVEAIVRLACGQKVRPVVVGRAQLDGAIKNNSIVIGFPNGSATVERTT